MSDYSTITFLSNDQSAPVVHAIRELIINFKRVESYLISYSNCYKH